MDSSPRQLTVLSELSLTNTGVMHPLCKRCDCIRHLTQPGKAKAKKAAPWVVL